MFVGCFELCLGNSKVNNSAGLEEAVALCTTKNTALKITDCGNCDKRLPGLIDRDGLVQFVQHINRIGKNVVGTSIEFRLQGYNAITNLVRKYVRHSVQVYDTKLDKPIFELYFVFKEVDGEMSILIKQSSLDKIITMNDWIHVESIFKTAGYTTSLDNLAPPFIQPPYNSNKM